MQFKTLLLAGSVAATSPNPNDTPGISAEDSDIYSCLQNGHKLCKNRMSNAIECVDQSDSQGPDLCTDLYSDKVFAHSIASISEKSQCPQNDIGEDVGAFGKLYFPNGKQKCTVVLGAKCGGPAFRVNPYLSRNAWEYEIYWAEWDYSMVDSPSSFL